MTFVLNLLHRDFSVIAADTKAKVDGELRLRFRDMSTSVVIRGEKSLSLYGFKKIHLSSARDIAIGIAGKVQDHGYIHEARKAGDAKGVLDTVLHHSLSKNHREVMEHDSSVENGGVVTYYERETGVFFSTLYTFSMVHNYSRLCAGLEHGRLVHAGSGSAVFTDAVGDEKITRFAESIRSVKDLKAGIRWMEEAYVTVSGVDEGTGNEMVGFVATKENPCFVDIREFER